MDYYCVSDMYDPSGDEPYASIEAFQAMCLKCHGREAPLRETASGVLVDPGTDNPILVPADLEGLVGGTSGERE